MLLCDLLLDFFELFEVLRINRFPLIFDRVDRPLNTVAAYVVGNCLHERIERKSAHAGWERWQIKLIQDACADSIRVCRRRCRFIGDVRRSSGF